jgi:uroporphyrinogen-III synthase
VLKPGGGPLLYLRGRNVSYPLDKELATLGFKVEAPIVYEALCSKAFSPSCQAALKGGGIEAITFFSKRTALNFMRLVEKHSLADRLRGIKALSISKPVLECVQAGNWLETYTAQTPDRSGMVDLVGRVCVRTG